MPELLLLTLKSILLCIWLSRDYWKSAAFSVKRRRSIYLMGSSCQATSKDPWSVPSINCMLLYQLIQSEWKTRHLSDSSDFYFILSWGRAALLTLRFLLWPGWSPKKNKKKPSVFSHSSWTEHLAPHRGGWRSGGRAAFALTALSSNSGLRQASILAAE